MTVLDRAIARTLPFVPKTIVRKVAGRYIAGETLEEALGVVVRLNGRGFRTTLDILGEHVHRIEQARSAVNGYLHLLEEIDRRKLDANISVKLTQLGLKVEKQTCLELACRLVRRAKELNNFVRIDMEDSSCTSDTLEIYETLRNEYSNVGVVIQACLRRTMDDVATLEHLRPNYRLCKGVYIEPEEIAYHEMAEINRNFIRILERLLKTGVGRPSGNKSGEATASEPDGGPDANSTGCYVGIATHDEYIIDEAFRLVHELKLSPASYEFQMLLGVAEPLRDRIRAAGHHLRVYIPFGRDWYAYSVRRLKENPRLAGYVLRSMFKRRTVK